MEESNEDDERRLNIDQILRLRHRIIFRDEHEDYNHPNPIPESNIFSLSSPQQFPFYKCKRELGQAWYFYGEGSRYCSLETKTGYYQEILRENVYRPLTNKLIGYRRDFRFYHGTKPGIETDWLVTEFGIEPDCFKFDDEDSYLLAEDHALFSVFQLPRVVVNDPPGCRFRPTDLELVTVYLKKYILGEYIQGDPIPFFDIYSAESPQRIPFELCKNPTPYEWLFFSHTRELEPNRIKTRKGHYKPICQHAYVLDNEDSMVGFTRTFEFSFGVPYGSGIASPWTVKEYRISPRILEPELMDDRYMKELVSKVVVCKVALYSSLLEMKGRELGETDRYYV